MSNPKEQEEKKGHKLLSLGGDVYAEVSLFRGVVYATIRKWFEVEEGRWLRTKNGLNLPIGVMRELLSKSDELRAFIEVEAVTPWSDEE